MTEDHLLHRQTPVPATKARVVDLLGVSQRPLHGGFLARVTRTEPVLGLTYEANLPDYDGADAHCPIEVVVSGVGGLRVRRPAAGHVQCPRPERLVLPARRYRWDSGIAVAGFPEGSGRPGNRIPQPGMAGQVPLRKAQRHVAAAAPADDARDTARDPGLPGFKPVDERYDELLDEPQDRV